MSKKPQKKSDLKKGWMQRRQDLMKKIEPEYHLIVTEGTDTEPLYFQAVKEVIDKKYRERIHLDISGKGDNTLSLFRRAEKDVLHSSTTYAHVWLVYDKDDFPKEHFDRTAELCKSRSSVDTTFHAIWSNQCIELWFLLHFMFLQSDLHRSEYWPKITEWLKAKQLGTYFKNRPDMFQVLRPYLDEAIQNAKKLEKINYGKTPSNSAPGTRMHELMGMLRPYI